MFTCDHTNDTFMCYHYRNLGEIVYQVAHITIATSKLSNHESTPTRKDQSIKICSVSSDHFILHVSIVDIQTKIVATH